MLESGRLHRPTLRHFVAGLAVVAIAAFSAMAEPASAQGAEDQAEFDRTPGQPGADPPPSIERPLLPEVKGNPRDNGLSFAAMANMVTLTEVISSNVALLTGTTSCDPKSNLAYNGEIENNNWNVRL